MHSNGLPAAGGDPKGFSPLLAGRKPFGDAAGRPAKPRPNGRNFFQTDKKATVQKYLIRRVMLRQCDIDGTRGKRR